ncbi:MAG: efflux RND transporter permease subunit, partial [Spirochaetes bacterium]|nr:efflux RND transporter permease subunit [Spirochaetota bacterium]
MTKIIKYFSKKHILTNFLVIAVFIGAILFWNKTGKEDMPNITFDFVSIRAAYPGATALEVEYFITKEIEEALEGIDGIKDINSTTSQGNCSVRIELEPNNPNKKNVADEIKDAMNSLRLPDDVENEPRVRQFKSSKRAIIDLMLTYNDVDIMDRDQRLYIQSLVDTIENKLLSLNSVSEVGISGYLNDFIEIQVIPKKLMNYNISLSDIISAINKNNIKQPVGNLSDENSTKIRLDAELTDIESIKNVIIQASFEGNKLYLKDLAHVVQKFEDQSRIQKVNGSEAIRINVTKTSSAGILDAIDQIKALVDNFKNTALKDSPVNLIIMDDESKDIRNRLSLIFLNGLFGFIL